MLPQEIFILDLLLDTIWWNLGLFSHNDNLPFIVSLIGGGGGGKPKPRRGQMPPPAPPPHQRNPGTKANVQAYLTHILVGLSLKQ